MTELKDAIDKCEEIGRAFEPFTANEWIFDNRRAMDLFQSPLLSEAERRTFNIDTMRINWRMYIMNWAYGLKRFVLKEEAELPSVGYNDAVSLMNNYVGENFLPFYKMGKEVQVRSPDDMRRIILSADEVKDVIA